MQIRNQKTVKYFFIDSKKAMVWSEMGKWIIMAVVLIIIIIAIIGPARDALFGQLNEFVEKIRFGT